MPIRVLFLHTGESWIRGSEIALLTLFSGLDREGITPVLGTNNAALASLAQKAGVETLIFPIPEIMIDGGQIKAPLLEWGKAWRRVSSVIKRKRIKLLYCNGGSTCQLGYYLGKLAHIPVISHLHSFYSRRYIFLYRVHLATRVIAVSETLHRNLASKHRFRGRHGVVHNGIDTRRFRPPANREERWRSGLALSSDNIVFGQVSSLISRKGIDVLLKAFRIVCSSYPASRLVLVGDGDESKSYLAMARQLGINEQVVFAGKQDDPLPFYQHVFDVNVLASRSEALPLCLLEAAACGLPNIGANVGGIREEVHDNRTGLLFESEHCDQLAEKMTLLVRDAGLRRKLGQAGRQLVLEHFSMEKYCGSIQSIILDEAKRS